MGLIVCTETSVKIATTLCVIIQKSAVMASRLYFVGLLSLGPGRSTDSQPHVRWVTDVSTAAGA